MAVRRLNASCLLIDVAVFRWATQVSDGGGEQELVVGDDALGEAGWPAASNSNRSRCLPSGIASAARTLSSSGRQDLGLLALELPGGDDSPVAEVGQLGQLVREASGLGSPFGGEVAGSAG